jgi:acetyl-CoA carboxylase biotin carboxyl carrier protein
MDLKDIQNLIKFVAKSGASEVKLETDDVKITIRTGSETETTYVQQMPMQAQMPIQQPMQAAPLAAAPTETAAPEADENSKYITIKTGSEKTETTILQAAPMAAMGHAPTPMAQAPAEADVPAKESESDESHYITVKSPIIGTFYRKPSPDKPNFVEVGSDIAVGDTVCVIEAMKLFNEIESEVSGKVVKVLVDDSSPVEFDQPLFLVDPS